MVRINKLQVLIDKLKVQLKHERVENKANVVQIRKLQTDIASSVMYPTTNIFNNNKNIQNKD